MANSIKVLSVSSKGQVVIPEELRDVLNIKKGSQLLAIQNDDSIVLMKMEAAADILSKHFKK